MTGIGVRTIGGGGPAGSCRICLMSDTREPSSQPLPPGGAGEAMLRLIADSVPALIAYYEATERRCRFANRRYAEYNGCTPDRKSVV